MRIKKIDAKNTIPKHNSQEFPETQIAKKNGKQKAQALIDADNPYKGLKVRVFLVKEGNGTNDKQMITNSTHAYELIKDELESSDRERFVSIILNGKNRPIGIEEISVGSLTSSLVHPREVFKSAILANAASIVVAHNHPSGVPDPSREDLEITRRLKEVGELMGIKLLDHLIIGDRKYLSMVDMGLL